AIIVVFLSGLFWLGSRFYRWIGDPDDFFVAGRQLTPFILAATLTTANISLFSLVGVSGTAYRSGISIIWLTWTGNMALVFSGLFVIPYFRRLRIRTVPEFLEMRYNGGVRLLVGILWVFRLAFWAAVVLYAGVAAAQQLTGIQSFSLWVFGLASIVIIYTMLGGMWSVVLTNNLGFLLMMSSLLILLPLTMAAVGGWPGLSAHLPPGHLDLVTVTGKYNWKIVIAFLFLGIQWATLDQGLLQAAFSARDPRVVSKGMVLSGMMITPFALLWILPGLAARILYPTLAKPEMAVPTLVVHLIPVGILGCVTAGLLASALSTLGSNLGAVATLVTNDIYGRFVNKQASPRQLLVAVRLATLAAGALMIAITYLVPRLGGSVDAYLTIISIMDMPLFVIAIPYGLLWDKMTSEGAISGYLTGSLAGAILRFGFHFDVAPVTLISGAVAALVCPVVSLMTQKATSKARAHDLLIRASEGGAQDDLQLASRPSPWSRLGLWILGLGAAVFLLGLINTGMSIHGSTSIVLIGMLLYFLGGGIRAKTG
ncbi:MAG: sodium:solute symporter family protein, partial [Candidatus Sulfotelmatobacter sp.]